VLALAHEQGAGIISIKPISWGTWPKEGQKSREWWYRSVEEPKQVELALNFALSHEGVATAIPTSFIDLFQKTVEAARNLRPLDREGVQQLQQMAVNRESLFTSEEKQVAMNHPHGNPAYPGNLPA
jgi:predicted aldo/keto reductase-like oxidoreductase